MNFADKLIERLKTASAGELPLIRADYEAHLAQLPEQEQTEVMNQIEPVLKLLMNDSVNRLEEAVSGYLARRNNRTLAL